MVPFRNSNSKKYKKSGNFFIILYRVVLIHCSHTKTIEGHFLKPVTPIGAHLVKPKTYTKNSLPGNSEKSRAVKSSEYIALLYLHRDSPMHITCTDRVLSHLGSGQFGTVYRGTWQSSEGCKEVAIKELHSKALEEDQARFLREAAINGQFNGHPNVVYLYGVVTVETPVSKLLKPPPLTRVFFFLNRIQYISRGLWLLTILGGAEQQIWSSAWRLRSTRSTTSTL